MNLFRSKEDVQNWSEFKTGTEEGILPLAVAADLLSTARHRNRLDPNYVSSVPESAAAFVEHLAKVTEGSTFWDPKAK